MAIIKEISTAIKREIRSYRLICSLLKDDKTQQYKYIRACLGLKKISCKYLIRRLYKDRHKGIENKTYKDWTRHQFDSCSYNELTYCVKARIEWIREEEQFLNDQSLKMHGYIREYVRDSMENNKKEINRLLKMRRVLKKSNLKNWDSNLLSVE